MRIGIEAQRIFREKKHGMDIYALELIKHLQKIDQENEYFIFVKDGPDKCLEETSNFKIIVVPGLTYADWEQVWLPIHAVRYDLDLLHCTSNTAPIFSGCPTMITLHDIIYMNQSFQGGSIYQWFGTWYRKWIVPFIYHRTNQVLTVSLFEKETITQYFGTTKPVDVVYNGLRKHEADTVSEVPGLPRQYILFLGNEAPKKNMNGVLRAYNDYVKNTKDPLPLVIIETSPAQLKNRLNQLGLNHLKKNIVLTGYVSNHCLMQIFKKAELFLYPSLRESFGIPIIEAMSAGVPVITSNTSAMPEVAGEAAILVNPHSTEEITVAIQDILRNQELRTRLQSSGLERAKRFDWEETARTTLQHYRKTVTSSLQLI
jgi:glycosyltransferase involved in cell wall biosynthesis